MKKISYILIGLALGLGMTAYAATTVSLGKNGTSEYLLYPTDSLSAYRFIATSTTASSTFGNGIDIANGCFAIGSVCLNTGNIAESGNLYFTNPRVQTYLDTIAKGYFWSTTSADVWNITANHASSTLLGDKNTWSATNTFSVLNTNKLIANTSAGTVVQSSNGTPVSIMGVGNSANALFYGGVNIDGAVRMATSLNGVAFLTNGSVSAIATSSLGLLTTNIAEGTNLYYTNPRVQTYLDTISKGYFFSTTSSNYWLTTKSLTAASSTLLGDENKWSSLNTFSNIRTPNISDLTGITGMTFDSVNGTSVYLDISSGGNFHIKDNRPVDLTLAIGGLTGDHTISFPDEDGTLLTDTALASYVPYTGAAGSLDLGDFDLTATRILGSAGSGMEVTAAEANVSDSDGMTLTASGGTGDGTGSGGHAIIQGGNGGDYGNGAAVSVNGGNSGTISGNGGDVQFSVGAGSGGGANGNFVFNGLGSGFGYLDFSGLTGNHTYQYPDQDGTLALLSDIVGAGASSTLLTDTNTWSATNQFAQLTFTNATGTNATTTNLAVSSVLSKILLTNATGGVTGYAGTSCTNKFVRSISALGAATCATVSAADVSLANLTATNASLTFSGTYNGATARTIGINMANANSWTGGQTFVNSTTTNATSTNLYVSGTARAISGSYTGVLSPMRYLGYNVGTTTAWTGTTSGAYLPAIIAPFAGTIRTAQCSTDTGTLNVDVYHTTTHLASFNASTTVGTITFSSNNTVTNGEKMYISAGTPASTPTSLSCTLGITQP